MNEWQEINRIADELEPEMCQAFLDAVEEFKKKKFDFTTLIQGLESGQIAQLEILLDSLDDGLEPLADTMNKGFKRGGNVASTHLVKKLGATIAFDLTNPRAIEWMQKHGGRLISLASEETKQAIRLIVARAFDEGLVPSQAARLIRQHIGLTRSQSLALLSYRKRILADNSLKKIKDRLIAQYAQKLLNMRAKNIARTETVNASNGGQLTLWQQAREDGHLSADTKKRWLTTPDDRRCERCKAMHGQEVGLDDNFSEKGGVSVLHPTLHPQCRCAMRLVFVRKMR